MRLLSPALKAHGLEMDIEIHTYLHIFKGKKKKWYYIYVSNMKRILLKLNVVKREMQYLYYVNIVSNAVATGQFICIRQV